MERTPNLNLFHDLTMNASPKLQRGCLLITFALLSKFSFILPNLTCSDGSAYYYIMTSA